MIEKMITALLSILLTLFLGFLSGKLKNFKEEDSSIFIHFVMLYALPITLFTGILSLSPKAILSQGLLSLALTLILLIPFVLVFIISHYLLKRDSGVAILEAIAIGAPAISFMGVAILDYLFGNLGNIPIAEGAILINLIMLPITIFILNMGKASATKESREKIIVKQFVNSLKQPVVWAPFLALSLTFFDIQLPKVFVDSLNLVGKTTAGLGIFAIGIALYAYKISISLPVLIAVISRNIIIPGIAFLVLPLLGLKNETFDIVIATSAIPSASICVILAVEYSVAQKEMASIVLFSTILSMATMAFYLSLV